MPLVQSRLGAARVYYTIDRGTAGATPDSAAPFIAVCHIFSDSLKTFAAAVGPHFAEIDTIF